MQSTILLSKSQQSTFHYVRHSLVNLNTTPNIQSFFLIYLCCQAKHLCTCFTKCTTRTLNIKNYKTIKTIKNNQNKKKQKKQQRQKIEKCTVIIQHSTNNIKHQKLQNHQKQLRQKIEKTTKTENEKKNKVNYLVTICKNLF